MLPITKPFTITRIPAKSPAEISAALAEVARIRAAGAGQPITIELAAGDYFLLGLKV